MKRFLILWLISGLILTSSCVAKKKFLDLESEKNTLSTSLEETKGQVKMLEEEKDQLTTAKRELESTVQSTEGKLATSQNEVKSLKTKMDKTIAEKDEAIKGLEKEMDVVFESVKTVAKSNGVSVNEVSNKLYLVMDDKINFRSGSARVLREDQPVLEKVAAIFKANPGIHYLIEGHTDHKKVVNGASVKDNWDLSTKRSANVARKLVALGVDASQFTIAGKSDTMPMVAGEKLSKEDLEKNRRVEFIALPNIGNIFSK